MYSTSILALTGALLSVVGAVPMADSHAHHHHHAKRDIVWVTQTEEQVVTVPVTKTVWIEPGETPPTEAPASSSAPAAAQVYNSPSQEAAAPSSSSAPAAPVAPAEQHQSSPEVQSQAAPATSQYVAPSPTSTYVAPAPATTQAPASSSTPAAQAPASSAAAPSASYSSGSGSSSGGTGVTGMAAPGKSYTGDLTWYEVGMGSCGETSSPSDHIVAVSHVIMSAYNGANPNANPLCNKYVSIKGVDGTTYPGKIVDTCPGCDEESLDLSEDFFNLVTNNGDGRVHNIEWSFT